ncbi:MAG: NAD-dependent succinate-semialdehyde dehydrogenase, partial [SAR324 cluster bacterium]|nr:NAD-dependent succinate-semialdehyde dehydrogenase [SAR324 cluster bacterium]
MAVNAKKGVKSIGMKDASLFRQQVYINGKWSDADSGETTDITNPSTGEVLGTVPNCGAAEAKRAIESANAAWPIWRSKTAKERAGIMRRWYELMMENQEDLARLMTAEQGKPLSESRGEIAYAAGFIEWFGEEGKRLYGDTIPAHATDKRIVVIKQPIGVTVAITPWNFPAAMITRKAAPALAAGCPMVIKPAPDTPFSAFALCELAERAGVPAGILSTVTGDAVGIGSQFTGNPIVRKLSFTGSTGVGKLLMKQCSGTVKKLALELGGNAPFIVFNDADLEAALPGAMASKFRNAGQTCVCANRIMVQSKVYDKFTKMLADAAKHLKVADGFEEGADQGPLINEAAV